MQSRILVCEDRSDWSQVISHTLSQEFAVTAVGSLDELKRHMAWGQYDLIISGFYEFSDYEGRAFIEILEAAQPAKRLPVILLARYAHNEDVFHAAKLGAYAFLAVNRPDFLDQLLASARAALSCGSIPNAFVSYTSTDRPFAAGLAARLSARGIQVWFDQWEILPGDSIVQKVQDGIASAGFLLVILSPASVKSSWVQEEVGSILVENLAHRGAILIPILKSDCDLPPFLRTRRYVDFRTDPEGGYVELEKAIRDHTRRITQQ